MVRQLLLRFRGFSVGKMRESMQRRTLLHAEQAEHGYKGNEGETKAVY
jgi:hypothetical protein